MKHNILAYIIAAVHAIVIIVVVNPPGVAFWAVLAGALLYPLLIVKSETAYTVCEFLVFASVFVVLWACYYYLAATIK